MAQAGSDKTAQPHQRLREVRTERKKVKVRWLVEMSTDLVRSYHAGKCSALASLVSTSDIFPSGSTPRSIKRYLPQ